MNLAVHSDWDESDSNYPLGLLRGRAGLRQDLRAAARRVSRQLMELLARAPRI